MGNYVSKTALAAVGSTDCIINTIIGFFSGLSTGAGVVISHNFGSRDDKALHCTVHTTIALTLVLAVFFTIAGLFLSPFFLRLMDTPEKNPIIVLIMQSVEPTAASAVLLT